MTKALVNNTKKEFTVPVRVYALLNYLKKHCVGKENITSCADLYRALVREEATEDDELNMANHIRTNFREERVNQLTKDEMEFGIWQVRQDIRFIRLNFSITICSSIKGYYIPTDESEDKTNFLKKHFMETAKTLLSSGISRKELHALLGTLPKGNLTAHGQRRIPLTEHGSKEVLRYSSKKKVKVDIDGNVNEDDEKVKTNE